MECSLGVGDLLRLAGGPRGIELRCLKGSIWLTKGDGVDYLVHAGNSFQLPAGATAIVEALGQAEFRLVNAAGTATGAASPLSLNACRACGC